MDCVAVTIHPFVINQEISVYKNGECVKTKICPFNDLEEVLYSLCKKYGINQVEISGGQLFALRIKENFAAKKYKMSDSIIVNVH